MALLRKGTATRTADQFAEQLDFIGGSFAAGVSVDSTGASAEFMKKDLATGLDLVASKERGEDGYFLMTLTAGDELAQPDRGMDYVFVLDINPDTIGGLMKKFKTVEDILATMPVEEKTAGVKADKKVVEDDI